MKQQLAHARKDILDFLSQYLQEHKEEFRAINKYSSDMLDMLLTYTSRGKMVRGSMVVALSELLGASEDAVAVGAAVELAQSAILMHDDIMDQDDMRRGMPSMHIQLAGIDKQRGSVGLGESLAICLGDIGFFLAHKIISEIPAVSSVFSHEMAVLGFGQMGDLFLGEQGDEPSITQICDVFRYKTGRYTFSLPFMLAATLCSREDVCEDLSVLGEQLGIVFQIRDDEIGLFGDEQTIGKPVGSDIQENKKTLHRHFLFKHANPQQHEVLFRTFGSPVDNQDISTVQSIARDIGVQAYVSRIVEEHRIRCEQLIASLDVSSGAKKFFSELLAYNLDRSA